MKKIAASILAGLTLAASGFALPTLQLDVSGAHTYNASTETIVSNSTQFEVYALLNVDGFFTAADNYTLVAALTPRIAEQNPNLDAGSFVIENDEIDAVREMTWGIPDGLADHGIYQTYYKTFSVDFTTATEVAAYNTQDDLSAGGKLLRKSFTVDVSGLDPAYELHFDLVGSNTIGKTNSGNTVSFAPYSHDAESGSTSVPEPATLSLLGLSLLVTGFVSRKKKQA